MHRTIGERYTVPSYTVRYCRIRMVTIVVFNFIITAMNAEKMEDRESLPFFIIVIAVMTFLYFLTLFSNERLRTLPGVIIFTGVMAVHAVLHWMFRTFSKNRRATIIYFFVQSLIAAALILYSREQVLIPSLYLPLLGEEAGYFRGFRNIIIIIAVNVAMMILTAFILVGGLFDLVFLVAVVPMLFFVIIYVNLYNRQLEARMEALKLLEELEITNRKLSASNVRVEALTREKERQRIARELHDTLAQGLSGLILQLEAAKAYLDDDQPRKTGEIIDMSMQKARETLAGSREVIDDLRQESPSDIQLADFVDAEIRAMKHRSGISFTAEVGRLNGISEEAREHLKKIITEAMENCAEHSGADCVSLNLYQSEGAVRLEVADDGRGFDSENVGSGHYGLIGIRERAEILGGELSIESSAEEGTLLSVCIPGENDEQ